MKILTKPLGWALRRPRHRRQFACAAADVL